MKLVVIYRNAVASAPKRDKANAYAQIWLFKWYIIDIYKSYWNLSIYLAV